MIIDTLRPEDLTAPLQEQVSALYTQLNPTISQVRLSEIIARGSTTRMVVCRDAGTLLGLALLAQYIVISGRKGMIEDVVVDTANRGRGIGRELLNKLLEEAKKDGLNEVLLFTGHHRIAAINLYRSMGFQLKESGLYTLKLS